MENLKPGIYEAKVVDYGIGKTKKELPMAMIRFAFVDAENQKHEMNWYGTFTNDKAQEITCEALAICGWSTNNPADLAKGAGSGVLDENKVVSITVAADEYEGKVRMKIKYINPPGGAGFRDKMTQADAVQMFKGLNIAGVAAAARAKHKKEIPNHAPKFDSDEPVPF